MSRIQLHDVPENRSTADLDHGLEMGFLGDAGSEATGKDDDLHKSVWSIWLVGRCRP